MAHGLSLAAVSRGYARVVGAGFFCGGLCCRGGQAPGV